MRESRRISPEQERMANPGAPESIRGRKPAGKPADVSANLGLPRVDPGVCLAPESLWQVDTTRPLLVDERVHPPCRVPKQLEVRVLRVEDHWFRADREPSPAAGEAESRTSVQSTALPLCPVVEPPRKRRVV